MGYGVGYRVPDLKERYYFFDHSALGYQVMGNPDLQPESSHSFQLGFDLKLEDSLHVDLNFYYNKIQDLIDTELDAVASGNVGLQVFTYQNIRRARTAGAELTVSRKFTKYMNLFASYVYLEAKDEDTDKWLTGRSKHQFKTGMIFTVEEWGSELLLNWSYHTKQYVDSANSEVSPGWNVFDIKFNQKINKRLDAFIGLKNVFDVHRSPNPTTSADLRPASGRYFYLGFKYNFSFKGSSDEKGI